MQRILTSILLVPSLCTLYGICYLLYVMLYFLYSIFYILCTTSRVIERVETENEGVDPELLKVDVGVE